MHEDVCRCLAHAHQRARVHVLTVRRCASCVRVRFPLLTAMDRHTPIDRYLIHSIRTPCPVRLSSYARIAEADMRHVRAQARVRARARVCAWARPHPRQRVRALPAAAERRVLGSQAFDSASAFNANIGAWNSARVTDLSRVCAASGPARTAVDCARPVVDACAAVVRRGAAEHLCVSIGIRIATCARARVHPRFSMSNAHMHRPLPCCMYTYIRIGARLFKVVCTHRSVSTPLSCARACVRVRVCVCVCVCVYCGALHACKLRESVNILSKTVI